MHSLSIANFLKIIFLPGSYNSTSQQKVIMWKDFYHMIACKLLYKNMPSHNTQLDYSTFRPNLCFPSDTYQHANRAEMYCLPILEQRDINEYQKVNIIKNPEFQNENSIKAVFWSFPAFLHKKQLESCLAVHNERHNLNGYIDIFFNKCII